MSILILKGVSKYYGARAAVHDISLEVAPRERLVIVGASGCGKSTLLRLVAGLLVPDAGRIDIEGETVSQDDHIHVEPEHRRLGMVFQDSALWPHLTVQGNLEFGLKADGVPAKEREVRIHEMLALTQMESFIRARPAELSGGQQQRVALARALIQKPRLLLMDEPLSNLDLDLNLHLRQEILRLHQALGFTLLYVTHDRDEARDIGTRVVALKAGSIEWSGPPEKMSEYFKR